MELGIKVTVGRNQVWFKQPYFLYRNLSFAFYKELLWKAPEVLRSANYTAGSQQADIYSLAIVIFEIFTRTEPFSHLQLQNTGVQSVRF